MGLGPLDAAHRARAACCAFAAHVDYLTDLLPALLVFSIGLALHRRAADGAVLSDADESDAGIASGVNNAIARVAGLLAIAAVGAVISAVFISSPRPAPRRRRALARPERRTRASSQAAAYARPCVGCRGAGHARRPIRIRTRFPRRHGHLGVAHGARRPTRPRSASATPDASYCARTAPAASSPASHSTLCYARRRGRSLRGDTAVMSRLETRVLTRRTPACVRATARRAIAGVAATTRRGGCPTAPWPAPAQSSSAWQGGLTVRLEQRVVELAADARPAGRGARPPACPRSADSQNRRPAQADASAIPNQRRGTRAYSGRLQRVELQVEFCSSVDTRAYPIRSPVPSTPLTRRSSQSLG